MQYQEIYEERKNNDDVKFWVVKKIRLLEFLQTHNPPYFPLKQQVDRNNPHYNVWIFKKSDGLLKAIEEYYSDDYFTNN